MHTMVIKKRQMTHLFDLGNVRVMLSTSYSKVREQAPTKFESPSHNDIKHSVLHKHNVKVLPKHVQALDVNIFKVVLVTSYSLW